MDFQAFWQMIPAPVRNLVTGRIAGLLTRLAAILVTAGALKSDQVEPFVAICLGLMTWGIGEMWTWMRERELPRLRADVARLSKDLADLKRPRPPLSNPPPLGSVPPAAKGLP